MLALQWDDILDHVLVVDRAFTYGALKALKAGTRRTVEVVEPLREDSRSAGRHAPLPAPWSPCPR
jgi:hypothetical protein